MLISAVQQSESAICIHISREGNGTPTPVLLPGKSHGWRSLVGCSPWGGEESDTTERPHFHFSLSCTGEGNGNPLQCSCLENPRDGAAWWVAVYGVAQSQTRLKWLSSSRSIHISPPSWTSLLGHPLPHLTPLGHHTAPSWAPWAVHQVPTSYLFYTW